MIFKTIFPDIFAQAVKIAIKIPSVMALRLTSIVIMQEKSISSPQPVSPKINKLNLSIKKEVAKATSYHIHFFINYIDILLTNDFFWVFVTIQSIIYLYKKNKTNNFKVVISKIDKDLENQY